MIVARRLISVPRLSSKGIVTKNVDFFTGARDPTSGIGAKPFLPEGIVVGMSMSMLKGLSPTGLSSDESDGMSDVG